VYFYSVTSSTTLRLEQCKQCNPRISIYLAISRHLTSINVKVWNIRIGGKEQSPKGGISGIPLTNMQTNINWKKKKEKLSEESRGERQLQEILKEIYRKKIRRK